MRVGETARGLGTASRRSAVSLATAALGLLRSLCGVQVLAQTPASTALPTAQVASGAATLHPAGAQLTVQQASAKRIPNWQSFNIGSGATVRFNQPGAASVAAEPRLFSQFRVRRVAAAGVERVDQADVDVPPCAPVAALPPVQMRQAIDAPAARVGAQAG